jgi:hypothetical protein
MYREMGMGFWLEKAETELAPLHARRRRRVRGADRRRLPEGRRRRPCGRIRAEVCEGVHLMTAPARIAVYTVCYEPTVALV